MIGFIFLAGDGIKTPALSKLIINSPNLGSLTSQSVYSRLLQNYSETRHYQDYPWKLSKKLARPTSQFMMLTLSNLFDRSPNYFTNLTMLKLTGECINTRLKVSVSSEMEVLDTVLITVRSWAKNRHRYSKANIVCILKIDQRTS